MMTLKEKFSKVTLPYIQEIKQTLKDNKDKILPKTNLGQLDKGMRDALCLLTETSLLDAEKGILFRGYSIEDLYNKLPKSELGSKEPTPELIFHLLLTGEIPTEEEIKALSKEWKDRENVPQHIFSIIDSFDKEVHPMIQFTTVLSALETGSLFNAEYRKGLNKSKYWEYIYEDSMNLIANLPKIIAYIYNRMHNNNKEIKTRDDLDYGGNFAHMIGDSDSASNSLMKEFFRLYLFLHSDHEGGNASSFACHVTGSTLASPYASFSSAINALSGPLHGRACEDCLNYILKMMNSFDHTPSEKEIEQYIYDTLNNGGSVFGYGHAVLRITDPRFSAQMNFCKNNKLNNDILQTIWHTYNVAPKILSTFKKIQNPYPNVDAHSGAILNYFGLTDARFYTVFFGLSRALGVSAQQIWARALGNPIFRPRSTTFAEIKKML